MDNQTLFEELGELAQQPVLWFARQRYQTDRSNHLPDNGRRLLRILVEANNPLTAGTIADILAIRPTAVNTLVKKLEAESLVLRTRDKTDAQIVRIQITKPGRERLAKIDTFRSNFLAALFSVFDDAEQAQFTKSLHKLNQHITSEDFAKQLSQNMTSADKAFFNELSKGHLNRDEQMHRLLDRIKRQASAADRAKPDHN